MNLEHLEAVKARIEEIRRKFVDPNENVMAGPSGSKFGRALAKASVPSAVTCPEELEPAIAAASAKYGVDAALIKGVIGAESGFRANAVSPVGAQGLMQLMPGTARALGVDAFDPAENIDGGTKYLKQLIDKFGTVEHAVAAYNAGPGSVTRYGGIPPYAETQRYVQKVMGLTESYRE